MTKEEFINKITNLFVNDSSNDDLKFYFSKISKKDLLKRYCEHRFMVFEELKEIIKQNFGQIEVESIMIDILSEISDAYTRK